MEWTDIRLTVAKADADNAEAVATMIAEGGIYIEDYSDIEQQVAEIAHVDLIEQELLDKPRDTVIIHMYLEPGASPVETLALIQARMEAAGIAYTVETEGVEQEDWQNGWRINASAGHKIGRFGRVGEFAAIAGAIERTTFISTNGTQFGLDRDTKSVTHFHDFGGLTNIFFIVEARTIKHHGGKAQTNGFHDGVKTGAMVKVQYDWDIMLRSFCFDGRADRFQRNIFKMHFSDIDDER